MSIRFDGNLGIGNLDVRDFIGLSDDEIRDRFGDSLRGMDQAELNEFMDELKTKLADIEKELKDLQDGYRDDLDEAEDSENIRGAARAELKLKEIDELMTEIDNWDDLALDVVDHNLLLNRETNENDYFSYNTSSMDELQDGETVTITATGIPNNETMQGIFGPEENTAVPQYDANGALIDTAVPDPADLGQIIFFNINAGDKISLVSEANGQSKFKISTQDGKVHYLVIKGNPTIMFNGSNYASAADLSNWPDDLLKRTYENNGSKSFYTNLHPEVAAEGTSATDAIIPATISANYASIVAEANQMITEAVGLTPDQTYSLNAALLTSQDQQKLQQMIEALYSSNAINSASTKTLQQVHSEIQNILASITSDAKRSSLMGALTLLLAKHDYSNFEAFFKPEIQGTAEFYMNWTVRTGGTVSDSWNAFEKFIRTIYDPNFLSGIQSNSTEEDTAALNHYSELMVFVGNLEQANAATDILGDLDDSSNDPIEALFTGDRYDALMNKFNYDNADFLVTIADNALIDGNTLAHRRERFLRLKDLLIDLGQSEDIGQMRTKLSAFFGDGHDLGISRDNLASIFVRMVGTHHPELAQFLFSDADINDNFRFWMFDGNDKPDTEITHNFSWPRADDIIGIKTGESILNDIDIIENHNAPELDDELDDERQDEDDL